MKKLILIVLVLFYGLSLYSQKDSTSIKIAQATFIYPLGTNGINIKKANIFSLNILAGVNGGLRGMEFGGIANINTGDVYGLQSAGVTNITLGNVGGCQVSGLVNSNIGDVFAAQFASVSNLNTGDFIGFSASTVNINGKNTYGHQVAAVANISLGNTKGTQLSGIINITGDTLTGIQIGLFNKTRVLNGTQIGLINIISDSSANAVPIGLFNFTKEGVAELEIGATEVMYGNLNLKFGGQRLYTILKTGFTIKNSLPLTSFGVGLGTRIRFGKRTGLSFEAETSQLNTGYYWYVDEVDILSSININFRYRFAKKLAFSIGPVYNTYVTQVYNDDEFGNLDIPYVVTEEHFPENNINVFSWVGAKAGIAFLF